MLTLRNFIVLDFFTRELVIKVQNNNTRVKAFARVYFANRRCPYNNMIHVKSIISKKNNFVALVGNSFSSFFDVKMYGNDVKRNENSRLKCFHIAITTEIMSSYHPSPPSASIEKSPLYKPKTLNHICGRIETTIYLSKSGSRLSRNVKSACVVYVMDSSHRNHRRAGT